MFSIILTTIIVSATSTRGNAVSTSVVGNYDNIATCQAVASKLTGKYSPDEWTIQFVQARCVQVK